MRTAPMATVSNAIARTRRGMAAALRSRARVVFGVAAAVAAFNLIAPVAVLSLARKPMDFFSFNPWLRRLPDYLVSSESLGAKLSFLSRVAIAAVLALMTAAVLWFGWRAGAAATPAAGKKSGPSRGDALPASGAG